MRTPAGLDPDLARLLETSAGTLEDRLGIELVELSAEHAVARMPVEGNTQTIGILHGGAHGVIAESLASLAALVHAGPGRTARGIELSASHTRSASAGTVTATCEALSLGNTLCVHEVVVRDEAGRRLSTIRVTNLILAAEPSAR